MKRLLSTMVFVITLLAACQPPLETPPITTPATIAPVRTFPEETSILLNVQYQMVEEAENRISEELFPREQEVLVTTELVTNPQFFYPDDLTLFEVYIEYNVDPYDLVNLSEGESITATARLNFCRSYDGYPSNTLFCYFDGLEVYIYDDGNLSFVETGTVFESYRADAIRQLVEYWGGTIPDTLVSETNYNIIFD